MFKWFKKKKNIETDEINNSNIILSIVKIIKLQIKLVDVVCKNVESNKTAFHEIRKVSKDAWTEISKTKSKAVAGAYEYKDEELKAARIEQLK